MAIPFITQFPFEYGECAQLSPLVGRVIANNPGPFTFTGTGTYIIGKDTVCVIDPGPNEPTHHAALERALDGRKLSHILLTHHHSDHSPLAAPLARDHGCQIYAQSLPRKNAGPNEVQLDAGNDPNFKPDIELKDGDIIKGEGWTIEALHTPGHCSNHLCFALIEDNSLFSGDHIMGWATSVVIAPDGHMGDYLSSLNSVLARDFNVIRPTHGAEITDPQTFVRAYIEHREMREAQIKAAVQSGLSQIRDIVAALYAHVDKSLHPAAAHSVLAHMVHLRELGVITADGPDGLSQSYHPA